MNETLENINQTIKKMPCCDFEIVKYNRNSLIIGGGYSLSYEHAILIEFESVFFMTLNSEWSIDTSEDFILLAPRNECLIFNKKYQIEQGNTLFKLIPEGLNENIDENENTQFYISAKNIYLKKNIIIV